jgi:NodT family efflux transporter outer membrane factor (OMF) lipoprotein
MTAQYEIDLWGRIDSRVAAERLRARATLADYQTAALSLSAEIVRTWYRLMESLRQLALLDEQIATNQKVLQLLRDRFGSGQVRSVDILRQEQLSESTREQRLVVESERAVLGHQLAVLLGRPPQAGVEVASRELPALPPMPATGIPGELLRRRPDVRRAYQLLLAADRDLAAALSNRYPRLSLTASLATAESSADDLFRDWFASLAANLLGPLFDGGARAAEVEQARAVKRRLLYAYGETALVAFREVEDALIQEAKQGERIASLARQVALARRAYEQLGVEYLNGLSNYIDVLAALTEEQALQRELVTAERELLELRVALYRALAGGFTTHREAP